MKNKIAIIMTFILLASSLNFVSAAITTEKGPNYETTCENNICQTTIYSYQKYWRSNDEWEEVDERFSDCSENGMTKYCSGNYHFKAVADNNGTISALMNGEEFTLGLLDILGRNRNFNPVIQDNAIVYREVVPNVDLKYYYHPTKLKE